MESLTSLTEISELGAIVVVVVVFLVSARVIIGGFMGHLEKLREQEQERWQNIYDLMRESHRMNESMISSITSLTTAVERLRTEFMRAIEN